MVKSGCFMKTKINLIYKIDNPYNYLGIIKFHKNTDGYSQYALLF